jgi:TRAP-type C4-dicarboxylate transport system permease small subunit
MLTAVQGVLTVGAAVLLAVGGFFWVQRQVHVSIREAQNDIAGFLYAVLGVLYAVLLAFVVIVVWQDFDEARVIVEHEAGALSEAGPRGWPRCRGRCR